MPRSKQKRKQFSREQVKNEKERPVLQHIVEMFSCVKIKGSALLNIEKKMEMEE